MSRTSVQDEAEAKMAIARMILKNKVPYFASIFYGFVPTPVVGLNTMGVTKNLVLYYDPEWVVTCSPEELAGALIHECCHVAFRHCERCEALKESDPQFSGDDAGKAADLTFNPLNREAGHPLPEGKGIYPSDFGFPEGHTLEEYYELFKKNKQAPKPKESGKQQQEPKKEESQSGGGGSGGQEPPTQEPGKTPSKSGSKSLGHGSCGGIAGNPKPFEEELDSQFGRSPVEKMSIEQTVAQDIKEHVAAHGRGSVPADLIEAMKQVLDKKSKIKWQKELDAILKKTSGRILSGGADFSLIRPSKRSYARGVLRPGLISQQPEVCIIHDTSGSMGEEQVKEAVVQTVAIFKSLGIEEAWYIQADTKVAIPEKRIRVRDMLKEIQFHGRGGTDFDAALRAAERLSPRPDIIIYITDGDGGATYQPKGMELVWCIVPSYYNQKPDVPFGHAIIITKEGAKKVA
jgi:predicted metal-dependent peptidase